MDFTYNKIAMAVVNEKDPLLREIWAAGYTSVIEDVAMSRIRLFNDETKYTKDIPLNEFGWCVASLRFKTGYSTEGVPHTWISEVDGSAEKFRKLIKAAERSSNEN